MSIILRPRFPFINDLCLHGIDDNGLESLMSLFHNKNEIPIKLNVIRRKKTIENVKRHENYYSFKRTVKENAKRKGIVRWREGKGFYSIRE